MISFPRWHHPPPVVKLLSHDLHVWSGVLDVSAEEKHRFWTLLAPGEKDRALRFHFERDRTHYVAARGMLRLLIGRYLACAPDEIEFSYSEYGKPSILHPRTEDVFQFNVSHARGVALFAFCWGSDVGVDVEQIRPLPDAPKIAARFFSEYENEQFNAIPAEQVSEAFFNGWTRKEAFIKAVGEGLSYPLNQFDVTLTPDEPARFVQIQKSKTEAAQWSLYTLTPMIGYVGAVALPGQGWRLSRWHWAES